MTTTYTVYGADGINAAAEKRLGLARSRIVAAMDDYCKKESEYKAFLARPVFAW